MAGLTCLESVVSGTGEGDAKDDAEANDPSGKLLEQVEEAIVGVGGVGWQDTRCPSSNTACETEQDENGEHEDRRQDAAPPELFVVFGRERALPVCTLASVVDS